MSNDIKRYSIKQFSWTGSTYSFSAEMSELGVRPGETCFGPLPSSPNHSGIILTNPDTGGEMEFQIIHVEFNQENEILWWTLRQDCANQAFSRLVRVVIYND